MSLLIGMYTKMLLIYPFYNYIIMALCGSLMPKCLVFLLASWPQLLKSIGVREHFVLGHTYLKIVRQTCQSNDIVKKLLQSIRGKRTKVIQLTSFSESQVNYANITTKQYILRKNLSFSLIFFFFTIALLVRHHSDGQGRTCTPHTPLAVSPCSRVCPKH